MVRGLRIMLPLALLGLAVTGCGTATENEVKPKVERYMQRTVEVLRADGLPVQVKELDVSASSSCVNLITGKNTKVLVSMEAKVEGLTPQQINATARKIEKFWEKELDFYIEESRGYEKNDPWVTAYSDTSLESDNIELYIRSGGGELRFAAQSGCVKPEGDKS